MADRFPLIYNPSAGQIQELAIGDNLDLSSSGIVNGIASITQLNVSGITTLGYTEIFSGNVTQLNVTGISTFIGDIIVNNTTTQGSITTTTSTTSTVGIHSQLSTSLYRSVEYTIQATEGTNYHVSKIIAMHDGSISYASEYGSIYNNGVVGTYDVDISGGNIRLLVTPSSASTTNYSINFIATKN